MIPGGSETESWGWYQMGAASLLWLPPTAFFLVNEATNNMRFSMFAVVLMQLLGILTLTTIDLDEALKQVEGTFANRTFATLGEGQAEAASRSSRADKLKENEAVAEA